MAKYLGLDLSTQSLSAIIVDSSTGATLCEESVNFGKDLTSYNAPSGFIHGELAGEVFSDPCMWLDAMDLLFSRLQTKTALSDIRAIAGSGQQHATVYLNRLFTEKIAHLNVALPLSTQLQESFSRPLSPIWMDNSTGAECRQIAAAVGGDDNVLAKSGSVTTERFSAAQIRKFSNTTPAAYAQTTVIHLASSFACSVLSGQNAPIDLGDGAGMNLLNLAANDWDKGLLDACADKLKDKLPEVKPADSFVGLIAPYFKEKYGFAADTRIYAFSGDNPNSLIGCGGALPGTAVISLGTSDTFFAAMSRPVTDPNGYGHVFGNPAGGYMSLICFRNGSLTREKLKDRFKLDWPGFSQSLKEKCSTIQLPWLIDELTPKVPACTQSIQALDQATDPSIIRPFIEGQFINMLIHSEWMGEKITKIILTGGASQNNAMAQIIADIFGATIQRLAVTNSAALGAAMRACQAAESKSWQQVNDLFINTDNQLTVKPQPFDRDVKRQIFKEKLAAHQAG